MTEEQIEKYENMTRYQKSAYTKKLKYGDEIKEWGRKGGQAKVPKGFSMHRKRISEIQKERHRINRENRNG